MIDYATFQRIQHLHSVEQLTVAQIAHAMALDARTVRRWLDEPRFRPRLTTNRVFKHWPEIFNHDATLTSTVLDRLLHHAETVTLEGNSFRMKGVIDN